MSAGGRFLEGGGDEEEEKEEEEKACGGCGGIKGQVRARLTYDVTCLGFRV